VVTASAIVAVAEHDSDYSGRPGRRVEEITIILNLPSFMLNYELSGCDWLPSVVLGLKASGVACWTSSISGALFDTYRALDSDEPQHKVRAPGWVRWLIIDRVELKTRRKLIWASLAFSVAATAAIYCFAPGGLLR
jgi:hypothetical protein